MKSRGILIPVHFYCSVAELSTLLFLFIVADDVVECVQSVTKDF